MHSWVRVAKQATGEREPLVSSPKWCGPVSDALASQQESDEVSNELGNSVSENEAELSQAPRTLWSERLKKLARERGWVEPLNLSSMPPLTVVSSCTGSCAEGAALKD